MTTLFLFLLLIVSILVLGSVDIWSLTPNSGYQVATFTDNDAVNDIQENHVIVVTFELIPPTMIVTSVTPETANLNELATFTLHGSNLTSGMGFWIDQCTDVTELPEGTSSECFFQCTPGYSAGTKGGVVKDKQGGNLLYEFSVDIVEKNIPVVTTAEISNITPTTATSGGEVLSDSEALVFVRGVCWSTSPAPIVENNPNKTLDGEYLGNFTSLITGLTPDTTYYVRAYAINQNGTGYGSEVSFRTSASVIPSDLNNDTVVDLQDAILALKVLAGMSQDTVHIDADVNGDGKIGMEEVIYILQHVVVML